MLERMWRKGDPPALLVGYKLIQSLWRMVERYLKKKKKVINLPNYPTIPIPAYTLRKPQFQNR